jgi:hypothetical protein
MLFIDAKTIRIRKRVTSRLTVEKSIACLAYE